MLIYFFIFLGIIGLLGIIGVLQLRGKFPSWAKAETWPPGPKYPGICAFDLDNTLTCGLDNAAKAIAKAKELGSKIAIVTARPQKFFGDLNFPKLGLQIEDIGDDFYIGEQFKCSFFDIKCMEDSIADTKVKNLQILAEKYAVDPKRIILLDDQPANIRKAIAGGFSGILANNPTCGLKNNVDEEIENILTR